MKRSNSTVTKYTAAAAVAALAAVAQFAVFTGPVFAQDNRGGVYTPVTTSDGKSAIKVDYSDLDLNSQAGSATLLWRMQHAAHVVCDEGGPHSFSDYVASRECERQAIDRAVAHVGNARIAQLRRVSHAG
jgi:UrcA family protein